MPFLTGPAVFRNVFILDSRNWFGAVSKEFDPASDLLLTYDFALKHQVEALGGAAYFVDHLVSADEMQKNNFAVYRYFREWHLDAAGNDVFCYKGVPFGFAFRLDLWNPLIFYSRARLCLEQLRKVTFKRLYVGTELGLIETILVDMGMPFSAVSRPPDVGMPSYYFPIHDWMKQNIRSRGLKAVARRLVTWCVGTFWELFDRMSGAVRRRPAVLVQMYHPTREIVRELRADGRVRVVLGSASKEYPWSRSIPIPLRSKAFEEIADELMQKFRSKRCRRLLLENGVDITNGVYSIVEDKVRSRLPDMLFDLDSIICYLDRSPLSLEVLIANIGEIVTLVDCVCRIRGIPSYLIVNGHMTGDFLDESKYASVINAYSTSIRDNYFRGVANVVALGDPRMDMYAGSEKNRLPIRGPYTIAIGASGHNNADLNSYVAVEFDFMYDVLEAVQQVRSAGVDLRVLIKVRPNGYATQYKAFTEEYFPGLVDRIVDSVPMREVLEASHFYISIYSQTLFEASCLGIPCVYYKKDNEILDPPFDGESELVTALSVEELVGCLHDFINGHPRYEAFLQREVMEKYIGPLDGKSVERNLALIYRMARVTDTAVA